jgi:hypothetical protein
MNEWMRVRGGGLTGDWVQLDWPGDTRLVCRAKWPPPRRVCFLSRPATNNPLVGWLVLDWTENRSFDSTTAHHTRGRNEVRFSSEATRNYPKTNSFASIVHPRIRDLYTHDVRSDGAAVCGNNVSPGRIHETG